MKKKIFSKKNSSKILSFFLCLLIVFFSIPSVIYAEFARTTENTTNASSFSANENDVYTYVGDAYEVEQLREENVKHFRLENGSYVAAQYNYPVHYKDESGTLNDIDNQLVETTGDAFANKSARIKFAKKITGNETLFALHDGNTKLSLSLSNATKGVNGIVTNYDDSNESTQLQKMMNLEKLSSSILYKDILPGVDIEYIAKSNNIKENIIVKEKADTYSYTFEIKLNGLSAELLESGDIQIINEKTEEIQYIIPAPVVYDANNETAPAECSYYSLAHKNGGKYSLTVTVSNNWMNDSNRCFPVTVDPAIVASNSYVLDTNISSAAPDSSLDSDTLLHITSLRLIHWKTTTLPSIPASAYITNASITLRSQLTDGDYVAAYEVLTDWDETLTWNQYTDATSPKGQLDDTVIDYNFIDLGYYTWNITPLVEKWYSGTNYGVAFNSAPGQSASLSLYSSEHSNTSYRPALTVTYKDMKGTEPYWSYSTHSAGIAGTGNVNLSTGQLTLAIPTLSTTDSLMPYSPTLVYNSSLSKKAYTYSNAETANTYSYMPYGFKLNICETVIKKSFVDNTGTTKYYYVYADPDGTEHGFYASSTDSSVYIDENGMQKTLTVQDNNLAITDDTKWTRIFTKKSSNPSSAVSGAWYLSQILDESGNAIIFTYDSSLRPTKVSMKPNGSTQIDFLALYYYSTGKLRMIYNATSKDAVVFRYSSTYSGDISTTSTNYLRQIDYAHGNTSVTLTNWEDFATSASNLTNITVDATAEYKYNSSGYITYAIDNLAGQKMYYVWSSKKVKTVRQYGGSTVGQSVSYIYGTGFTDVKNTGNDEIIDTDDDIMTRYVFDDEGRSKAVYSYDKNGTQIYGATVGEYETQENIKNNLKEQTVLGGASVNYLLNGDFEETTSSSGFTHWSKSGAVSRTTDYFDGEGEYSVAFAPTAGSSAAIAQYVSLSAGVYTLSMPYITQISDGVTGFVKVTSTAGSGFSHSEEIPLNPNYSNGIKTVFSTSFTVPNYTDGGDKLKILIKFTTAASVTSAPRIEIDRVMLEKNLGASSFSLVSYGSFDACVLNSSGTVKPLSSYWTTQSSSAPTIVTDETLFGNAAKVTGQINGKRYVKQRIYQLSDTELGLYGGSDFVSNANQEYIVSGFASADGAVYSPKASFRIRIDVIYYQGADSSDVTVSHSFDFVPSCVGWQFTGGSFSTKYTPATTSTKDYSCVKAIDVYCEYSYQPNGYALFDNISVTNSNGTDVEKYYYYSEGTANGLLSRKENIFFTEYYEYDENRNLSRVANNQGQITDYFYTSKNLVDYTIDYEFSWLSSGTYPYDAEDPDAIITKTPKTKTDYTYNAYGLVTKIQTYQIDESLAQVSETKKLYNHYVYDTTAGSKTFGVLKHEEDGMDVDIYYYYDSANGRLVATVNSDENSGICYSYDAMGNLVGVTPASFVSSTSYSQVTGAENVTYTYNSNNLISTISTDTTTYSLTYDVFGNPKSVKAGDNSIASYTYNTRNGKLNKVTYSNGFIVEYVYNDIELLTEVWYTDSEGTRQKTYEYEYTAKGQVYKFIDNVNERSTVYKYDNNNRLVAFIEYDNDDLYHDLSSQIYYDDRGRTSRTSFVINHQNGSTVDATDWSYSYEYDDTTALLEEVTIRTTNTSGGEYYYYDDYHRVYRKVNSLYKSGSSSVEFTNQIDYTYSSYNDKTSGWIRTYTSTVNSGEALTYTLTHDHHGNIKKIVFSTGEQIRYVYDDMSQLLREDNGAIGCTYVYTYDNAGNILTRTTYALTAAGTTPTNPVSTNTYTYSTSAWGDLLTSYNGNAITYDSVGNPLTYYGNGSYTFSWTGKELTGAVKNGSTYSFTYNDSGIRTSKTKNGVTTTYYLNGSQILAEETSGNVTVYIYDSEGFPLGMQYHEASYPKDYWDIYWYEKNVFGDIVAVYNESGLQLISYTYDAYGKCTSSQANGGYSTPAYDNPFRYRGYYYDRDLGLYYLNSRYYDAYTGRFISADNIDVVWSTPNALTDKNLYSYCDNNPVMRRDDGGAFWDTVFDVVSLAFSVADVIADPSDTWAWVGLAGDVVDLIPFVSGVGEATDLIRVATKTDDFVDAFDGIYDTAKAIDRIGDGLDTSNTVSKVAKTSKTKGWRLGDDVSNLTKAGNEPSWSTVRQRYWKNQAALNDGLYNSEDIHRMKKGLAPIREGAPMELHHPFGRKGANFYIFEPVTKSKHHFIHYGW